MMLWLGIGNVVLWSVVITFLLMRLMGGTSDLDNRIDQIEKRLNEKQ